MTITNGADSAPSTPDTSDPDRNLNLPVIPVDQHNNSPLTEFQIALTDQLATELAQYGLPFKSLDGDQFATALLDAVTTATGRFWHAERTRGLIMDGTGAVRDGFSYHGAISPDPTTPLYGIRVTARYARRFTEDEQRAQEQRLAAHVWTMDDHDEPPPAGVTTAMLLEQDVWWKPEKADPIRLEDMAVTHQANLLGWLYRRAAGFHGHAVGRFASFMSGPLAPGGDMACDDADREFDGLISTDPAAWMAEQPLVRRLTKLIKRAPVRPICRNCHRPWSNRLRRTTDCVSPSNTHGPWVLPDTPTPAGGSTENTVSGAQSSGHEPPGRTPTNDDINFGVRVLVLPGPHHGAPKLTRNHGAGEVTWMRKNIDPTKTRFGVSIDAGGTSEAGLADVVLLDEPRVATARWSVPPDFDPAPDDDTEEQV